jgi:hypothetical protein
MSEDISVWKEFIRQLHGNVCINSTLHMNNSNASGNRVQEREPLITLVVSDARISVGRCGIGSVSMCSGVICCKIQKGEQEGRKKDRKEDSQKYRR